MTTPTGQVAIRPPALARIYVAAFMIVWVGGVIWTTMVRHHGSSILVGVVFVAFGAALGWRLLRLGVRSDPDGTLTVHNNFGSKRLSRAQIEEFRIGSNGGTRLGQRGVQALLRDGTTYGLDVCRTPLGFGAQRLTTEVDQLNDWLRTSN